MNKSKATKIAKNNKMSWAEIGRYLDNQNLDGMSKVNPLLTKKQAHKILKGALDGVDMSAIPPGMRYCGRRNKEVMTGDALGIANILREFG